MKKMANEVIIVKTLETYLSLDILFCFVWKCGECPYLFATVVANAKIWLDTAGLNSQINSVAIFHTTCVCLVVHNHLSIFVMKIMFGNL